MPQNPHTRDPIICLHSTSWRKLKSYRTKNWHCSGKEMKIYLKINFKKTQTKQTPDLMHNIFREGITVASIYDPHSLNSWYMAKLQSFPPVRTPATTFLSTILAICILSVASLVSSMPGLMVTKPSHLYSHRELVLLFVVVSKCILSVLLVDKCEHLIKLRGEGNFFACCSALEKFTNFRVAVENNSKITSQLSNCKEKSYAQVMTCKVNAFYAETYEASGTDQN